MKSISMIRFFAIITASVLISSCASKPTQEELANADYGIYPENYQEIIVNYFSMRLKDPSSAQYSFLKGPEKQWYGFGNVYGYGACFTINAKNSYGGYTGQQLHFVMIRDGRVVKEQDEKGLAIQICKLI